MEDLLMEDLLMEDPLGEETVDEDTEDFRVHKIRLGPQLKSSKSNPKNYYYYHYYESDQVFEDYVRRYNNLLTEFFRYKNRFGDILKNGFNRKNRTDQMEILEKVDGGIEKMVSEAGFENYKFQEIVRDFKETIIRMSRSSIKPIKTYSSY